MQNLSRRQFFRLKVSEHVELFGKSLAPEDSEPHAHIFRPPGACADETVFLSTCERCKKCSDACPHNVIFHLGPSAGAGEGTPYIEPNELPCHWCPSMDCIQACPTDTLSFNDANTANLIGKAELDIDLCLTQQGILCDDCVTVCPSGIQAITIKNNSPVIDEALCVGCGMCAYHCPAPAKAIRIGV